MLEFASSHCPHQATRCTCLPNTILILIKDPIVTIQMYTIVGICLLLKQAARSDICIATPAGIRQAFSIYSKPKHLKWDRPGPPGGQGPDVPIADRSIEVRTSGG